MASVRTVAALFAIGALWAGCSLADGGLPGTGSALDAGEDVAHGEDAGKQTLDASPLVDAAAPVDAADAAPPCPLGLPGPALVRVGGAYCIDGTEVTNAQFDAYRSKWDAGAATGNCSWVTAPAGSKPGGGNDDVPVTSVTWCDAAMYCKWAGKHLCGARGGGTVAPKDYPDAAASEWFNACSSGGANAFPYGAQYVKANCNTEWQKGQPVTVGSFKSCLVPSGAVDLSGNVREWVDSCDTTQGRYGVCQYASGDYGNGEYEQHCSFITAGTRESAAPWVGFRCCF